MSPPQCRSPLRFAAFFVLSSLVTSASSLPSSSSAPDLSDFKTPDTAQTIRIDALSRLTTGRQGFLGINSEMDSYQRLVVMAVAPGSPAFKAGVKTNDIIIHVNGREVASPEAFRALIQSNAPGTSLKLGLRRDGEPLELTAKLAVLGSVGRSLDRVRLGARLGDVRSSGGVFVEELDADSRGARAGLKVGDLLLKINNTTLDTPEKIADLLTELPATETVKLSVSRGGNNLELQAQLAPSDSPDRPAPAGRRGGFALRGGGRGPNSRPFRDNLQLAIVGIEFPDVKHNPAIGTNDWQQEFFSTNTYTNKSATGLAVHGSLNDYYSEQSDGLMRVSGRMFDWVEVSKDRFDYSAKPDPSTITAAGSRGVTGGSDYDHDGPLLNEVLEKLLAREGRDALLGYDGVVFLYAGHRAAQTDTDVYWPHSTSLTFQNRRVRYLISNEGGERMADISVLCHETGHILGLPDLYVRRQPTAPAPRPTNSIGIAITGSSQSTNRNPNPYVETLANWDLMAVQAPNGRPQHLSAWSKEQLGWLRPTMIDPTVPQKLVLAPVEKSTNQCFKIPLRPDGSEYLLLENRRRLGFDLSVPAEGLLIWRVVYGRPVLEEAHGFTGPSAATVDIRRVPYPTDRNTAFTPFTKPSSAAFTGDELPVYITDIRRLPDGKITFSIGDNFD